MKKIIVVDSTQQAKEKNVSFLDYPMKDFTSNEILTGKFSDYYDSWEQYLDVLMKNKIDISEVNF
ncbi:MAG: hypothetical protein RBR08_11335 [Desulforegulaceae bacterium]|nr:hypothetical protein [Desulforegulaceae bacterium]